MNQLDPIETRIYKDMFNRIRNCAFDYYSKSILESHLPDTVIVDQLFDLQEGIYNSFEGVFKYIKDIIMNLFGYVIYDKDRRAVESLKWEYNDLYNEYINFKDTPEFNEEEFESRLEELKNKIEEFKANRDSEVTSDLDNIENPSEVDDQLQGISTMIQKGIPEKPIQQEPQKIGGSGSVGDLTSSVDMGSTFIWRKHWKTRCTKYTGRDLNRCKAQGVDYAISFIRSKISYCSSTVDPEGCRNTLMNLVKTWMDRKRDYLR